MVRTSRALAAAFFSFTFGWALVLTQTAPAAAPATFRAANGPAEPLNDSTVIAEAEEFHVEHASPTDGDKEWVPRHWGDNYYAATLANTFLSRKAYLGAPEQADGSTAHIIVKIPKAGRYLALARYEAAVRFQTQFRLQIEQGGKTRLDRLYGARDNPKIWAFHEKIKPEAVWSWGAVENVVWEGHDAFVELDAGEAKLTLIASRQPEPAARRNVDLVMLTSDVEQVHRRIEKENYLPLDGMLTQAGDLYVKLHNDRAGAAVTVTLPPGIEHSPYWVHMRNWEPKKLAAGPGESTDWVEVGSLLDSLNDGQWRLSAEGNGALRYGLEFGAKDARGKVETIRTLEGLTGNIELAYRADTRYVREIRPSDEVLYDLLAELKKQPVDGVAPKRTLVYGHTFERRPRDAKYNQALDEFVHLIGATAMIAGDQDMPNDGGPPRGYIDLREKSPEEVRAVTQKLAQEGRAGRIAVVSLGDEIGLPSPPAGDDARFRKWLKEQNVTPEEVDPSSGGDWEKIKYTPDGSTIKDRPGLYYYSRIYGYRFGIGQLKQVTDILRQTLPSAGIGANYSPHHGHLYLGGVAQWVSMFREGGMTMPWGEDYAWQAPIGSQQMNEIALDLFRCGVRDQPGARIQYYVMPHAPGNTPASWRRQFYADLGHGMKIVNLFEFRPVQAAYTENHVTGTQIYQEVRRSLHELGRFEDIIQDGQVRAGSAGLWFSEAGDLWDNSHSPFDAGKRTLYVTIKHQQLPLDVVVEADALAGRLAEYKVLYLADQNVSRGASKAIARWVTDGGRLFATAGAGMFDEFNKPNATLRELLGVDQTSLEEPADPVRMEKQDLPFANVVDTVKWTGSAGESRIPVIGVRSRFALIASGKEHATITGTFADGSPALTVRRVGSGSATYCGFLPGLSYFKPAIPLRPVDRGTTDDAMCHFFPHDFDPGASQIIGSPAIGVDRPVTCTEPLVETMIVQSKQGTVIPLVNWTGRSLKQVTMTFTEAGKFTDATLSSGRPMKRDGLAFTFDLEAADALILR
ncbi:MAG: Beta-galactosidase trimerization domain protein [Phycisphaerales bacterium]|nr:Beta-galactosidase trimerization domain protein [Phycisphaerales bacterium]